MTLDLKEIVEQSYRVFKKYRAVAPLDACTHCCLSEKQEQELVNTSVRFIPFELLYDYNTAAKTENPSIEEFKHFLPRILDLTSEFRFLHHDAEICLSRFEYYEKKDWTTVEQDLLQAFGRGFFQSCLGVYPLPELTSIDGILIMLMKAKLSVKPMLLDWTERSNREAVLHFSDLVNFGFKDKNPSEFSNVYASSESASEILNWLESEKTRISFASAIESIILETPANIEENKVAQLSWTYEIIGSIR